MKGSIHVCKVKERKIRSYLVVEAKRTLANYMSCPCDKIISSETHIIIGLPKTRY